MAEQRQCFNGQGKTLMMILGELVRPSWQCCISLTEARVTSIDCAVLYASQCMMQLQA